MVPKNSDQKEVEWLELVICKSKKSKFIKEQEAKGLLSSLGIKIQLRKITLSDNILFYVQYNSYYNNFIKMI